MRLQEQRDWQEIVQETNQFDVWVFSVFVCDTGLYFFVAQSICFHIVFGLAICKALIYVTT